MFTLVKQLPKNINNYYRFIILHRATKSYNFKCKTFIA